MTKHLLPYEARALLQRAAATPIPPHDPLSRVKAIESASSRLKLEYPQFFRKETEDVQDDSCCE